eukprot:COSAG01_NODE_4227_length_5224_cov_4.060683_1_plen_158_part_10
MEYQLARDLLRNCRWDVQAALDVAAPIGCVAIGTGGGGKSRKRDHGEIENHISKRGSDHPKKQHKQSDSRGNFKEFREGESTHSFEYTQAVQVCGGLLQAHHSCAAQASPLRTAMCQRVVETLLYCRKSQGYSSSDLAAAIPGFRTGCLSGIVSRAPV